MAFPTSLTNAVDGVTEVVAGHLNNLEAKVGIDGSQVTTSLDYLLKNPASMDPGHGHSPFTLIDFAAIFGAIYCNDPAYNGSLAAADAAAYAAGKILLILPGAYNLTSDLTFQAAVQVLPGAMFNRSGGNHLTFANVFSGPGLSQCFNDNSATHDWVVLAKGPALPEWWGAKADGATDSGAAINSALLAASKVQLTTGSYRTSIPVSINNYNILQGEGMFVTSILPLTASNIQYVVMAAGSYYQLANFKVDGDNNALNVSGQGIAGICTNPLNGGYHDFALTNVWVTHLSDEGIYNETYNNGDSSLQMRNGTYINCWADHCATFHGYGGFCPGGDTLLLVNCQAWNNGRTGVAGDGFNLAGCNYNRLVACISYNNMMQGIQLTTDGNNGLGTHNTRVDCICYGNQAQDFLNSNDSNSGNVWVQDFQQKYLPADANITSTTLTEVTDLTVNLQMGQVYGFRAIIPVTADASGGAEVALTGSATVNHILAYVTVITPDPAIKQSGKLINLETPMNLNLYGNGEVIIEGSFWAVAASGTIGLKFALKNAGSYTTIVRTGASIKMWPIVQ